MLQRICCLAIGYLCGCVLFSDIVARLFSGRSAFELGDGNPGMANVGHVLGTKAAILSLLGDILKTVAAVALSNLLFPQFGILATGWAGLGATLGHDFPFWHGFKGGKGVTTIASTIILMNPLWGITAGIVGVVSIVLTGYLSVAALIAMAFYLVVMFILVGAEPAFLCVLFMALQVYGHWSKLKGIADGTTKRAGLADKVRLHLRK